LHPVCIRSFYFTAAATPAIYSLSLHDALPIWFLTAASDADLLLTLEAVREAERLEPAQCLDGVAHEAVVHQVTRGRFRIQVGERSEEHTSELQSRENLVCRLLLENKNS